MQRVLTGAEVLGYVDHCHDNKKTVDLSKTVISNLESHRINLMHANLRGTHFICPKGKRTDLPNARFNQADLTKASLNFTELRYAIFDEANLTSASIQDAHIYQASFNKATLQNAKLDRSDLRGASFEEAKMENASLASANLANANLFKANLSSANLYDTNLTGANLQQVDLTNANLTLANFGGADLKDVNFTGAQFFPANEESLNDVYLIAILNNYTYLYINTRFQDVDKNLGILRHLVCDDLIRKINAIQLRYGDAEASKLFTIAINHPFFSTHRKDGKIDPKNKTKSQKRLEQAKNLLPVLIDMDSIQHREIKHDTKFVSNLGILNGQQLYELMRGQQRADPIGDNDTAYMVFALTAHAGQISAERLSNAINRYRSTFPDKMKNRSLLSSLETRYLSLMGNKAPLIELMSAKTLRKAYKQNLTDPFYPSLYCNLRGSDFTNCQFGDADLRHTDLSESILIKADLSEALLGDTHLAGTSFFPQEELAVNARPLLDWYADIYTDSDNLKILRSFIVRDLISKILTEPEDGLPSLQPNQKIQLLEDALHHRLFSVHADKAKRVVNKAFSFFADHAVHTTSQKALAAEIKQLVNQPRIDIH